MAELVSLLLVWVSVMTGYHTGNVHPKIEFINSELMNEMYQTDDSGVTYAVDALALYSRETKIIYLNNNFDINKLDDKALLVHELTHYLQDINEMYTTKWKHSCYQPGEVEAYAIEIEFLKINKVDEDIIKKLTLHKRFFTICDAPYRKKG